jgi:hypothetical protein
MKMNQHLNLVLKRFYLYNDLLYSQKKHFNDHLFSG